MIANIEEQKVGDDIHIEKSKRSTEASIDEKVSTGSIDLGNGDEALRLIGIERTAQFSEEYNKALRRKLDWLIPPLCAAVYFTQFLDKTSLNYASIMGLPITGQRYNLVSLAFYLGFLVWEFPTVYISQKTRVAKYLGANIIIWGIVLMLHSVGTSFGAFFALRFLLGMCESCVAPSLILIISMFYKKNEQVGVARES
jgi:ACS family allantoate permease-like MFS transporter